MKRDEILKKIRREASRQGISWGLKRHGANHDVFELGGVVIPVARHREIADRMATVIFNSVSPS